MNGGFVRVSCLAGQLQTPLAPAITITETAAVLAAELLVGDYDFRVDIPLVTR
jgi:hypothetical protein